MQQVQRSRSSVPVSHRQCPNSLLALIPIVFRPRLNVSGPQLDLKLDPNFLHLSFSVRVQSIVGSPPAAMGLRALASSAAVLLGAASAGLVWVKNLRFSRVQEFGGLQGCDFQVFVAVANLGSYQDSPQFFPEFLQS